MTAPGRPHTLLVLFEYTDVTRDTKRIHFQCSDDGCLDGTLTASPARAADAILALMAANCDHSEPA